METLRTEIIETQKVRSDLLKLKLVIIAGVGAAALGFSGDGGGPSQAHLALAVIPLACVYVDLLCRHLSLRNRAIGYFIAFGKHDNDTLRKYELFYDHISDKAWNRVSLESVALIGCTILLSVAIVPIGILASGLALWPLPTAWPAPLFIFSGLAGFALSLGVEWRYRGAKKKARDLSDKYWGSNAHLRFSAAGRQPDD